MKRNDDCCALFPPRASLMVRRQITCCDSIASIVRSSQVWSTSQARTRAINIVLFESVHFCHPDFESTMISVIETGQDSQNDLKQSGRNAH